MKAKGPVPLSVHSRVSQSLYPSQCLGSYSFSTLQSPHFPFSLPIPFPVSVPTLPYVSVPTLLCDTVPTLPTVSVLTLHCVSVFTLKQDVRAYPPNCLVSDPFQHPSPCPSLPTVSVPTLPFPVSVPTLHCLSPFLSQSLPFPVSVPTLACLSQYLSLSHSLRYLSPDMRVNTRYIIILKNK